MPHFHLHGAQNNSQVIPPGLASLMINIIRTYFYVKDVSNNFVIENQIMLRYHARDTFVKWKSTKICKP